MTRKFVQADNPRSWPLGYFYATCEDTSHILAIHDWASKGLCVEANDWTVVGGLATAPICPRCLRVLDALTDPKCGYGR